VGQRAGYGRAKANQVGVIHSDTSITFR